MTAQSRAAGGALLWRALLDCPPLVQASPERDSLWLEVRAVICTRAAHDVTPFGSAAHVHVSTDNASEELITAMAWLYDHESRARSLDAQQLLYALRGVATRSATGSGRTAQADAMHGMTDVPSGRGVLWSPITGSGAA
jgi:hypothetical protein